MADVDGDGRIDIYFPNQAGNNELWRNLGNARFENISHPAVALAGRISVAASFADIDNDGDQDLFVTTVRGGNVLLENDGKGHFRDITAIAGVGQVAHSSGSVFFDYNNDGRLDLLVCNVGKYTSDRKGAQGQYEGLPDAFSGHLYPERMEHPALFENLGARRFRNITTAMHIEAHGWCGDASFMDLNEDGWPDLYFLNMMGPDHYFENQRGRGFVEKTAELFPRTSWGSMGVKAFDFDNDGRMDVFVTDMHSDMFEDSAPGGEKTKSAARPADSFLMGPASTFVLGNSLHHNLGGGKFEEVSDRMGVENYWPWGPSVADLNADGWEDVFIASSMNFPFRYGINSVFLNGQGRKFLDAEFVLGVEPRRGGRTHTPWFQLDCAAPPPDPRGMMRQICAGQQKPVTVLAPLGSRSAAIFDADNDGDLDIVTSDFNSAPQLLLSDLAQRKPIHWLQVQLVGTASNRDGLGATIRLTAGGHVFTRYHDGKSGYLSQSAAPVYFGLGDDTTLTSIDVRWPSGRRQTITQGISLNTTMKIVEPRPAR